MKNNNCSKCGAPLKAGAKFCTVCGTPVQKKKNGGAIAVIVILVVLIVAFCAIICLLGWERETVESAETWSEEVTDAVTQEITEAELTTEESTTKRDLSKEWKKAYREELEKVEDNFDNYDEDLYGYYQVADIYGDQIPELIIHSGTCEADALFDFYTYTEDGLQYLGCTGAGHTVIEVDKDKTAYLNSGHMGYQYVEKFTFEDGEIKTEVVFQSDEEVEEYTEYGECPTMYDIDDYSGLK